MKLLLLNQRNCQLLNGLTGDKIIRPKVSVKRCVVGEGGGQAPAFSGISFRDEIFCKIPGFFDTGFFGRSGCVTQATLY